METIHLIYNSDPYGDAEYWCDASFPLKSSRVVAEVNCADCLIRLIYEADAAKERLAALQAQEAQAVPQGAIC